MNLGGVGGGVGCECDQNTLKFSKKVFIIKKEKETKKLGSKSFLHLCKDINLYKEHSRFEPWQIPKHICIFKRIIYF